MIELFPQFSDRIHCRFLGRSDDRTLSENAVTLDQVHGNTTVLAGMPKQYFAKADGVMTNISGLDLTIQAADCQNFALYAPDVHACAVLHAGWRGLLCGAIPKCIDTFCKHWNVTPGDIHVTAGPSLCTVCAEFSDPIAELVGIDPRFFSGRNVDLQGIAEMQLFATGISPNKFYRHPDCTRCTSTKYLSYRGGDREVVIAGISNMLVITLL